MATKSELTQNLLKLISTDYPLFVNYCNYLDKGLRKDALKCLDQFLDTTINWNYLTKANFCKTFFSISTTENNLDFLLTTNLANQLIRPTLIQITTQEPNNYLAFKWYGQYFQDITFVKKAFELNPYDNSIKIILINNLENEIWFSIHHLQDGYLGNIEEDEHNIKLAFSLLDGLDIKKTSDLFKRFTNFKNELDKYKSNNS